jgi:hypothetical protein
MDRIIVSHSIGRSLAMLVNILHKRYGGAPLGRLPALPVNIGLIYQSGAPYGA